MPIEIRELVIRAVVDPPCDDAEPRAPATAGATEREAIVEACVAAVLKALRRADER